jgi:hypothetical protein
MFIEIVANYNEIRSLRAPNLVVNHNQLAFSAQHHIAH